MTDYRSTATSGPGYTALPYVPRPVRPPLTPRAKRGATIAGVVGFVLLSLGYAMVSLAIGIGLAALFIALIVRAASSSSSEWYSGIVQFLAGLDLRPFIVPLVLVGVLGVVLMIAAIVVSGRVLRAHQVRRPWAVTWAGAGIAVVASWLVSGVAGLFTRVGLSAVRWNSPSTGSSLLTVGVISVVISLVTTVIIGWLSWWWMAHAFRPASAAPESPSLTHA